MGHLLHVLAALFVVGLAESGLVAPAPRPLLVVALLAVPHVLALAAHAAGRRGAFRRASLLDALLRRSAPLLFACAVLGCGWMVAVERLGLAPGLLSWPGPGLLVSLVPYALLELLVIDARARLVTGSDEGRRQVVAHERRLLAAACLPFALYVAFAAAVGAHPRLRILLEEVGLWSTAFTVVSLGAFVLVLPAVLRRTWSTSPLPPGGLRSFLEDVARRAGFRYRELFVWNTGERMANAAVVGLTGAQRYVLFTDALLRELTPREIAAVFAHEIGHAVRRHAPFFVLTLACVFFGVQLVLRLVAPDDLLVETLVLVLVILAWSLGFGYLSRRFELEADLESLELIGDPAPLVSALAHVTGAHAHEKSSWRHFSTARRIAFLERTVADPGVAGRLRTKLLRARRAFVLVFVLVVGAELHQLVDDYPEERTIVALRLGDYEEARRFLPEDGDPLLARLVDVTRALGATASVPALEESARAALAEGRLELARDLVELAWLRGGEPEDATRLLDRLEQDRDAEPPRSLSEAWRAALEAYQAESAAPGGA